MPFALKISAFPYIFLFLTFITIVIITYSCQLQKLILNNFMSNSIQYYQINESILKLPVENNKLKFSNFELVFVNNSLTYFEKEPLLKNIQQVSTSRVKNLENFCKNWRYSRTTDDIPSITLFRRERTFECRVPKTGQCQFDFFYCFC